MSKELDITKMHLDCLMVELEGLKDFVKNERLDTPKGYIYQTGVINGIERSIQILKEFEKCVCE